jgi:hypothetical protein
MGERPFMGDSTSWLYLKGLADGPEPLLTIESGETNTRRFSEQFVALTGTGHRMLAGEWDRVRMSGIDRRHGGVRLQGTETSWRWEDTRRRLVSTSV